MASALGLRATKSITHAQYASIQRMLTHRMQHLDRLMHRDQELMAATIKRLIEGLSTGGRWTQYEIDRLEGLFRRDDSLQKTFYGREKDFTQDLAWFESRVSACAAEQPVVGFPVFGDAEVAKSPAGYYPEDFWCAPVMVFDLVASAPTKTLTVHGRVPDQFPQGQTLQCMIGVFIHTAHFAPGDFSWTFPAVMDATEPTTVRIQSSASVCPARENVTSTDQRELAYHLYSVEVV
jgi:hypothetical protein